MLADSLFCLGVAFLRSIGGIQYPLSLNVGLGFSLSITRDEPSATERDLLDLAAMISDSNIVGAQL